MSIRPANLESLKPMSSSKDRTAQNIEGKQAYPERVQQAVQPAVRANSVIPSPRAGGQGAGGPVRQQSLQGRQVVVRGRADSNNDDMCVLGIVALFSMLNN